MYLDLTHRRESELCSLFGPAQGHVLAHFLKVQVGWLPPLQNRFDNIRRKECRPKHTLARDPVLPVPQLSPPLIDSGATIMR